MNTLTAWIGRNIIAADPNPEPSRLDLLDMVELPVTGECWHQRCNICDAGNCNCGCHR